MAGSGIYLLVRSNPNKFGENRNRSAENDRNPKTASCPTIRGAAGESNAMSAQKLLTIAIASMLLIGGLAAVGAAVPADGAGEESNEANTMMASENASVAEDVPDNTTTVDRPAHDRAGGTESVGPSDGLPEQAPDHVSEIHATIDSYLTDSIANLGESLQSLLGGGQSDAEDTAVESGNGEDVIDTDDDVAEPEAQENVGEA